MTPLIAPVRPSLATAHRPSWRVSDPSGDVIGYVDQLGDDGAIRYRARAMVSRQPRFHDLGEFWRFDDAVECFVS
jgi:hypothetical protein